MGCEIHYDCTLCIHYKGSQDLNTLKKNNNAFCTLDNEKLGCICICKEFKLEHKGLGDKI